MHTVVTGELGAHAADWDRLVDASPLPSPFLRSWWLAHTAIGEPRLVLVVDGDVLVGGIAVQLRRHLGVERVEMAGTSALEPDHLDALAIPSQREQVAAAIRSWMRRPGGRVIDLRGLTAAAPPATPVLATVFPGQAFEPMAVAPYAELPATWDEYLASRPGQVRSTIKRASKRLTADGVTYRVAASQEVAAALDSLRRLHDHRWGERSGLLERWPALSAAVSAGMAVGEARLHQLVHPDVGVIATELDFHVGGRVSFYQAGRLTDQRWRGSGSVLRARIIEAAIAEGCTEYDLLRGDESYKDEWSTAQRSLDRLTTAHGAAGRAYLAVRSLAARAQRPARGEQQPGSVEAGPGSEP